MFVAILSNGNVIVMGGDSCVDSAGGKCKELSSTSRRPYFRYDLWEFQAATLTWVRNSRPHNSRRYRTCSCTAVGTSLHLQVQHYDFTPFGKVSAISTVGNKVGFRSLSLL